MLSTTQSAALERGTALLRAAGLRYAIEMPDLTILGSLPVPKEAPPPPVETRHKRRTLPPLNDKYQFKAKVDAMQPGSLVEIACENEDDAKRIASHLSARGAQQFGTQSCISARKGLVAELLRVS